MFARVVFAEAVKSRKVYFFSSRTFFWALALPLGNGLYLYFLYLPFAAKSVDLQFNAATYKIDLVGFTIMRARYVWDRVNASLNAWHRNHRRGV